MIKATVDIKPAMTRKMERNEGSKGDSISATESSTGEI